MSELHTVKGAIGTSQDVPSARGRTEYGKIGLAIAIKIGGLARTVYLRQVLHVPGAGIVDPRTGKYDIGTAVTRNVAGNRRTQPSGRKQVRTKLASTRLKFDLHLAATGKTQHRGPSRRPRPWA